MIMENLVLDLETNNTHIVLFFNSHHLYDCIDIVGIHVNDVMVMRSKVFCDISTACARH